MQPGKPSKRRAVRPQNGARFHRSNKANCIIPEKEGAVQREIASGRRAVLGGKLQNLSGNDEIGVRDAVERRQGGHGGAVSLAMAQRVSPDVQYRSQRRALFPSPAARRR